jgi:hypothetical protein
LKGKKQSALKPWIRLAWLRKDGRNWHFIYKTPEFDVCSVLEFANVMPGLREFIITLKELHPFFPLSCPILPHAEYYYNIPITSYWEGAFNFHGKSIHLPNGLYKFTGSMYSKADPIGGYFEVIQEVKRPQNLDQW